MATCESGVDALPSPAHMSQRGLLGCGSNCLAPSRGSVVPAKRPALRTPQRGVHIRKHLFVDCHVDAATSIPATFYDLSDGNIVFAHHEGPDGISSICDKDQGGYPTDDTITAGTSGSVVPAMCSTFHCWRQNASIAWKRRSSGRPTALTRRDHLHRRQTLLVRESDGLGKFPASGIHDSELPDGCDHHCLRPLTPARSSTLGSCRQVARPAPRHFQNTTQRDIDIRIDVKPAVSRIPVTSFQIDMECDDNIRSICKSMSCCQTASFWSQRFGAHDEGVSSIGDEDRGGHFTRQHRRHCSRQDAPAARKCCCCS